MKPKIKLTLLAALGVILIIGVALLFHGVLLRQYVSRVVVEQQFSTATLLAKQLDDELRDRLEWVDLIVKRITPEVMANSASLTQYLKERQIAAKYFHGGIFITDTEGVCLADFPGNARFGESYADRDYIRIALREKRSVVGRPVFGKSLKQPVIPIATPILRDDGVAVGVFVGVMTYDQLGFLGDAQAHSADGQAAHLLIYSPKDKLTAYSDQPGEVLAPLSAADLNTVVSAPLQAGQEGKFVGAGKGGEDIAAALKIVPSSGWVLALVTPLDKIHQGIDVINLKLYAAGLALSLLQTFYRLFTQHFGPLAQLGAKKTDAALPRRRFLSSREKECLQFIAKGMEAVEIAERLNITERTVLFHLSNGKKKLSAVNLPHAIYLAMQQKQL